VSDGLMAYCRPPRIALKRGAYDEPRKHLAFEAYGSSVPEDTRLLFPSTC
jgi:hypothetical protein